MGAAHLLFKRARMAAHAAVRMQEDDGEIPEETEAQILETLIKIRRKDPSIYNKDVAFFQEPDSEGDEEGGEGEGAAGGTKKAKPMALRQFIAKQVRGARSASASRACAAWGRCRWRRQNERRSLHAC